jgi:hypothetical protein
MRQTTASIHVAETPAQPQLISTKLVVFFFLRDFKT